MDDFATYLSPWRQCIGVFTHLFFFGSYELLMCFIVPHLGALTKICY